MKPIRFGIIFFTLSLVLAFSTACSPLNAPTLTPTEPITAIPTSVATPPPAPIATWPPAATPSLTLQPTESAALEGACLVGKWQLDDYSSYFQAIQSVASLGARFTIQNQGTSGSAYFMFNPDGTAQIVTDSFKQTFLVKAGLSGKTKDISAKVELDGTASADYTVAGNSITYTNQDYSAFDLEIEIMGERISLSPNLLGEAQLDSAHQYECVDDNTLSLRISDAATDSAPLVLKRVP